MDRRFSVTSSPSRLTSALGLLHPCRLRLGSWW
ncbi:hypothetical protein HID58_036928 [Brassica napus]|uniref:Uncharacterized protein n=1 Tax=Brassica napus TaxID=3708 RepID=A0ABQ8C968_BRANA|nr:hypothetical protein HID58_036928 [Brassica napus]